MLSIVNILYIDVVGNAHYRDVYEFSLVVIILKEEMCLCVNFYNRLYISVTFVFFECVAALYKTSKNILDHALKCFYL